MNTGRPSRRSLAAADRGVENARDAVAVRITPQDQISVDHTDIIEVGQDGAHVRLFFRPRKSGIFVVVSSRSRTGDFGPVLEVALESPDFQRVVNSALEQVGAKLKPDR